MFLDCNWKGEIGTAKKGTHSLSLPNSSSLSISFYVCVYVSARMLFSTIDKIPGLQKVYTSFFDGNRKWTPNRIKRRTKNQMGWANERIGWNADEKAATNRKKKTVKKEHKRTGKIKSKMKQLLIFTSYGMAVCWWLSFHTE